MLHKGNFIYNLYNSNATLNPPAIPIRLCTIAQFPDFRFRRIYAGFPASEFATTGQLLATLTFWLGDVDLGAPVLVVPLAICPSAGGSLTYHGSKATGGTAFYNVQQADFFSVINRSGSGAVTVFYRCFDIDIQCNGITLDAIWTTNQFSPRPSFLASRSFTHPAQMYHENNFEAYA